MSAKTLIARRVRYARRLPSRFINDARGATSIEYSLIVALIFVAIVGAVRAYTTTTNDMYQGIDDTLAEAID